MYAAGDSGGGIGCGTLNGLASAPVSFAGVGISGTISAVMHTLGQLYVSDGNISAINLLDVTLAGTIGAMTYGASLWSNLFIGVGGVIVSSGLNPTSPLDFPSLGGVVAGTLIGYPVGVGVERLINQFC